MNRTMSILAAILISGSVDASDLKPVDSIPEHVKSITVVIPIYSQKVAFRLPTTWKAAFQDQNASSYLIEFIPKTEIIQSWSNLLSVQGYKGLAKKTTPEDFLDNMASGFKATCGNQLVYEKLGPSDVDGYKAFTAILGCAQIPHSDPTAAKKGQSEVGYYFSIKGEKDHYLIHKSVRGDSFQPSESPVNKSNALAFVEQISPIELCKKGGQQGECRKKSNN